MRMIPSCEDLAYAVSSGSYEEGPWLDRALLRLHMVSCWVCRRYIAQIRWIDRTSKLLWSSAFGADEDFKRRLLARLRS